MPEEPIVQETIYEAPEPNPLDKEALDALINQYVNESLLPAWYTELTKTALTRNITIDDWNTLCFLIRRVSADKVAYSTFKEFSDAICNYMKNNFALKGHNLISVVSEGGELRFTFEDGGYFYITENDLGLRPMSQVELEAILTRNLL